MRWSRLTPFLLGLAALGACDRVDPPTTPLASPARPVLGKNSDPLTRASFRFRNETGQTAQRLVVVFTTNVVDVAYASRGSATTVTSTVTLGAFTAAPLEEVMLTVIVEGRNARIDRWHWADANGAVLGTERTSCSAKQSCETVPAPAGFVVTSTPAQIMAGQIVAYCYYFRLESATPTYVRAWRSTLGTGIKRMNVVLTSADVQPVGTLSAANCVPVTSANATLRRTWAYTAYQPTAQYTFPSDDGAGNPLGFTLAPGQSGYLYIEYENPTLVPFQSGVTVELDVYERGTLVTPASSFVTYDASLSIPPSNSYTQTQTCPVPQNAKFFYASTYAHKQMLSGTIRDGATTLFQSTDPYNPGYQSWTAPFVTFATGQLTTEFVYENLTNRTITAGESVATDEHAVALTYFYPATQGLICWDGIGPY